jgi:exopolysaccharide production protein ExoY
MAFIAKDISNAARGGIAVTPAEVPQINASYRTGALSGGDVPRHGHGFLYTAFAKRAVDILLVLLSAPIWLPLVALGAALVVLDGHNPFYSQERIGRNGRVFRIWKLRSMVPDADAFLKSYLSENPEARAEWDSSQKLKQDPRITVVGRLLRKTSLDELPQLINVLTGDMSLVGPRPIMVNQKTLYPGRRYYNMRPGLTGLWQVSDRNECSFADRARYDDIYHRTMSLGTDLRILGQTVAVVLRGTGY